MALWGKEKKDLLVGEYRSIRREQPEGHDGDHVPSRSAIKRYAILRYGLVIPSRKKESASANQDVAQRELWKKIEAKSYAWSIPRELHEEFSRTYQQRFRAAEHEDMVRFLDWLRDEMRKDGATLDVTIDALESKDVAVAGEALQKLHLLMRRPESPMQRDYGKDYLRLSAEADIEALTSVLKKDFKGKILRAASGMFLESIDTIDDALGVMAVNQERLRRDPDVISAFVPAKAKPLNHCPVALLRDRHTGEYRWVEMPPLRQTTARQKPLPQELVDADFVLLPASSQSRASMK